MTQTIAGVELELDAEGFLLDHTKWNEEIARELARQEGIELTPRHMEVLAYMRKEFETHGEAPSIRKMKNAGGIPTKELYELFPDGPAKKAAKIAGVPKPHGCI
jgi:dissimilatory sulfite reductase related protein